MKYKTTIEIQKPINTVLTKWKAYGELKNWQKGLESVEHIKGRPGETGSKMRLNYRFDNNQHSITESIANANLPEMQHTIYSSKGLRHIKMDTFESIDENSCKWICNNEFVPTNFKMYFLILFMPKTFKKQTLSYMKAFKNYVEKGISIAHETD